jgi:CHAT domain-containing protein
VVVASCHGVFDDRDFLRSQLILAHGKTLSLGQALAGEPGIAGLRLLILSACQTAVANLRGAAEEVRSLAVGMLQAGAEGVLGSLWPVDGRATYLLMTRFMHEWLPVMRQQEPARALARAQSWLRTATNRDLAAWMAQVTSSNRKSGEAPASGTGQSRNALTELSGPGDRASKAETEQPEDSARQGSSPDAVPYADPVFWAGFQIVGR